MLLCCYVLIGNSVLEVECVTQCDCFLFASHLVHLRLLTHYEGLCRGCGRRYKHIGLGVVMIEGRSSGSG